MVCLAKQHFKRTHQSSAVAHLGLHMPILLQKDNQNECSCLMLANAICTLLQPTAAFVPHENMELPLDPLVQGAAMHWQDTTG
jgi:hypothetical protein